MLSYSRSVVCSKVLRRQVDLISRSAFLKSSPEKVGNDIGEPRKRNTRFDGPSTVERFQSLEKHSPTRTTAGYSPPKDVEERLEGITSEICGNTSDWRSQSLEDRKLKFKLLTRCISEFGHDIPNPILSELNTNEDVLNYFNTPVRDRSSFENLAKLDLPRNLHIQQEPLRFDPDTDTMFGGVTAFPGGPTKVISLKTRKKYKGTNTPQYWRDQHVD